jgi:predicted esterase
MTDPAPTFEAFLNRFLALYQQGAYGQALHMIETDGSRFPENLAQIMAWQVAMLSRLERVDKAVQVLQSAEALGFWYHEQALLHDPDFAALRSHPLFSGLVERMAARRQAAIPQMLPTRQVIAPTLPGPRPLFLALHGNFANLNMTVPFWRPLVEQGWTLAALQSSQPGWASDIFVWDDVSKSLAEIKEQYADLLRTAAVDPQAVIAGGFSMGAAIAVRMALDPAFSLRGIIAHEAWFTDESLAELEQAAAAAPQSSARVLLIAGQENGEYVGIARQVQNLLAVRGIPCRVMLSSNPRHGFPPEFPLLLRQATEWIIGAAEE